MTVHFDEAWYGALSLADTVAARAIDVIVVRDVIGRITFVLDPGDQEIPDEVVADVRDELTATVENFTSDEPVILASDLLEPNYVTDASDLTVRSERADGRGRVAILERGVVGADWERLSTTPPTNRVVLYGFRGGVGRSTAASMLAQHLAARQKCVLVVDLDLESPGVSSLLQDVDDLPPYGIVDHLVEAAVGNAAGLELVSRSRVLEPPGNGEVWLAPAAGRPRGRYHYLPKLNRIYTDPISYKGGTISGGFGERLGRAVTACEQQVRDVSRPPDVVILDSRSGIHDIAAVAITQLSDLSLLFATDSRDTWEGYRSLFDGWAQSPQWARVIRDRLKMVAAFVPAVSEEQYLEGFRDNAQACFADTLYDDLPSGEDDTAAYNPPPEDEDAPHSPLPILFTSDLVGLDTSVRREWSRSDFVEAAFRRFLDGVEQLILGGSK
jgi:hypothetical protein